MTIAIGALSSDALIIGADTEEGTGYAGDFKRQTGKISGVSTLWDQGRNIKCVSLAVTGAGDSAYLSVIKREVETLFSKICNEHKGEDDGILDIFEGDLKTLMKEFFHDHVIPFAPMSSMDLRVELIIGAQDTKRKKLWVTNLSTVRSVATFQPVEVGSGQNWAHSVMRSSFGITEEIALTVQVARAIFIAKEHAQGCGKETTVYSLRANDWMFPANKDALRELDAVFRGYGDFEAECGKFMAGVPPEHAADFLRDRKGLEGKLVSFRTRIGAISKRLYDESLTIEHIRNQQDSRRLTRRMLEDQQ